MLVAKMRKRSKFTAIQTRLEEWHVVDITLTDLRHEMIQVKCNRLAYAMEVYNANGGYMIRICKTGIHCWALNARYAER